MSKLESIDHQIERLLDAFDGAKEEVLKLAVVENGLALLETRLWLEDFKEAAIFCVELERLRVHLVSASNSDAFKLFSIHLKRLSELGTQGFSSTLLGAVNEMRVARGAMTFERATSLTQAERAHWREMHRRTNVPRRLRRHISTALDLLEAAEDAAKSDRALPLLGREADALKRLFRFNPSSLVWGSLHSLCVLAQGARRPISFVQLRAYCERLGGPSDQAKSLTAALPCLAEISAQIRTLDQDHLLPDLLEADREEPVSGAEPSSEASVEPQDVLPAEVRSLADAAENLSRQIVAGLLEETALVKDMQSLAMHVLDRAEQRSGDIVRYVESLEHLCELIDLAASGANLPESEFESLSADLKEYTSGAKTLKQIDEALIALKKLRDRVSERPGRGLDANLDEQEFEDLLARVSRIQEAEQEDWEETETRFLGYLLVRGGLNYAVRHREEMCIEPAGAPATEQRERRDKSSPEYLIEDLFPQSGALKAPKERLCIVVGGTRITLACDEVRGPIWFDLLGPPKGAHGFARLADGISLCVLSPERLLLHCQ